MSTVTGLAGTLAVVLLAGEAFAQQAPSGPQVLQSPGRVEASRAFQPVARAVAAQPGGTTSVPPKQSGSFDDENHKVAGDFRILTVKALAVPQPHTAARPPGPSATVQPEPAAALPGQTTPAAPVDVATKPVETSAPVPETQAAAPAQTIMEPRAAEPQVRDTAHDNVKMVNVGNELMKEARRRAQGSLDEFFKIGGSPPPGYRGFMVKVALRQSAQVENIWVGALERRSRRKAFITVSESFHGRLANEPVIVKGFKMGDRVPFSRSDILDWMYFNAEGRMIGNYSACAAAVMDTTGSLRRNVAQYGLDCSWTQSVRVN